MHWPKGRDAGQQLTCNRRAGSQSLSLLLSLPPPLSLLPPPLRRRRSSLRRRSLLSFLCLRLFSLPRFSFFSFFRFLLQGNNWWAVSGIGTWRQGQGQAQHWPVSQLSRCTAAVAGRERLLANTSAEARRYAGSLTRRLSTTGGSDPAPTQPPPAALVLLVLLERPQRVLHPLLQHLVDACTCCR